MGGLIESALSKALMQVLENKVKNLLEVPLISKAIDETAKQFPDVEVSYALKQWCESKPFYNFLDSLKAGARNFTDDSIVSSFVSDGGFYVAKETNIYAERVLLAFAHNLTDELVKSPEGPVIIMKREETLHKKTHEGISKIFQLLSDGGLKIRDLNFGEYSSLSIPWRDLPKLPQTGEPDIFRLLNWSVKITGLIGRDEDRKKLLEWARSNDGILVRFLVGPGGAGKSRLAFEVADDLRKDGWSAGQAKLDQTCSLPIAEKGLFLVVDYPEARRAQVCELLRNLSQIEDPPAPIRVLLLSRLEMKEWHSVIDNAIAASICDAQDIRIGPLEKHTSVELFNNALESFSQYRGISIPLISNAAFDDWLEQDRETHRLPLFIIAAALHCVFTDINELSLTGANIVKALVRRERFRLDNAGRSANWGEKAASRIVGLATASGGIDAATVRRLTGEKEIGLPIERTIDAIKSLGLWQGDRVPAPSPDIVAAELLFSVLKDCSDKDETGAWLWACLKTTATQNIDRLGRIAYDIATLRGTSDFKQFADWLAVVINGRAERAKEWRAIFEEESLPLGVVPLAVAIGKTLLDDDTIDEADHAYILSRLSYWLSNTEDTSGALKVSREAVSIYTRLTDANPILYKPNLAQSLRSLSICLREEGNLDSALEASIQAGEIYSQLANENSDYLPDLARSNHILALCLGVDISRIEIAIDGLREAIDIWRKLIAENRGHYESDLALSLNNLSVCLRFFGDSKGALQAITEAVEIWHRLARENPAKYEPDLAMGLSNLACSLSETGDETDRFEEAIRTTIKIYKRIAAANPKRYEFYLAQSLDSLSRHLSNGGNLEAAVKTLRNSIEIQRKLATTYPTLYDRGFIRRLERLYGELSDEENVANVFEEIQIAESTVCILLVRGENPDKVPIYAYVAVRADKIESFMEAQKSGLFYPQEFGIIVESGEGEPSPEVRTKMEIEYGFNHEAMVDIPNTDKADEIVKQIKPQILEKEEE